MATDRRGLRAGFRVRVLGVAALLLAVSLGAGLVIQRTVLLRRLDNRVDTELRQERRELEFLAAGRNPETGAPFVDDVSAIFDTFLGRNVPASGETFLTFVDGVPYQRTAAPLRLDAIPELVDRWGSIADGEQSEIDTDAGPVRYIAVPLRFGDETRGVFVAANFLAGERDEIEATIRLAALVAAIVLLGSMGAAWIVAGRLLRPVRDVTETARKISDSDDLSRRIPTEGDDEITELARTFNAMLDRLESSFTSQRAFVDDAGHELRTPITIVRGHLELLGDDPQEQRDTVALVTEELDRMARIVDDLLLLAKAERPDFVRLEPVELADFTTELLAKARALGARDWRLDACANGAVVADPQRLTQAVLNLARNAVEHTPPGAEIAIGSRWATGELRLWVRDTGPGIEPAEQDRIFERFARGRSEQRRSEGAGLGLAIVSAIASSHRGRVELESRPGEGATFTIVLPAVAPPTEVDLTDELPTAAPATRPQETSWPAS